MCWTDRHVVCHPRRVSKCQIQKVGLQSFGEIIWICLIFITVLLFFLDHWNFNALAIKLLSHIATVFVHPLLLVVFCHSINLLKNDFLLESIRVCFALFCYICISFCALSFIFVLWCWYVKHFKSNSTYISLYLLNMTASRGFHEYPLVLFFCKWNALV